jgi:hypothetical protein
MDKYTVHHNDMQVTSPTGAGDARADAKSHSLLPHITGPVYVSDSDGWPRSCWVDGRQTHA